VPLSIPQLSAQDTEALREYWGFYEPLVDEIQRELDPIVDAMPVFAALVKQLTPSQRSMQNRRSRELQRAAIVDGVWEPYLADLEAQGSTYARQGIPFRAWFELIAAYRNVLRGHLVDVARNDVARATRIGEGMSLLVDIAMTSLAEAYLAAKEDLIREQQAAIRDLSMPILQIREGMLVVPLVGSIDAARARLLTENLLVAVRDRRARAVVLDVTGVPMVDTAVASYLVHATEAAKLMGARVVITGIAAEIAQTLVTLGARLPEVNTAVDLQDGIEHMQPWLSPV
jgi:rsbT co-antagonist protein RsbR